MVVVVSGNFRRGRSDESSVKARLISFVSVDLIADRESSVVHATTVL